MPVITEIEGSVVQTRKLYWCLGGTIVCERDGLQPGFPITKRYFGQGVIDNGTKLFYTTDHLGSVRSLLDENGNTVADYRYSIYGERTKVAGNSPFDRWFFGGDHKAMTDQQKRGYELFIGKARCVSCHTIEQKGS